MNQNIKVALVHDYLNQYGGAEKTLEALIELFPQADIYTGIYEPTKMTSKINQQKVFAPKNGLLNRFPKCFTFLMPFVFESFDLRDYDLVFSDGTAWAKSVLTKPDQMHISYIHTPPRFLYKYSVESQKRDKWYFKPFIKLIDFFLLIWDYQAAQRPDYLLTNSQETAKRIKKFYKRDSVVIYPPVEIIKKETKELTDVPFEKFYLMLGRLAAYKNFDFVIKAFEHIDANLVLAGTGTEENKLKKLASNNIHVTGGVTEEEKEWLLQNCLGVINPVIEEDLGIVPVEAMSRGKPVLAHNSGGHKETVNSPLSGMFFESLDQQHFIEIFEYFDRKIKNKEFDAQKIEDSVADFSKQRFKKEIEDFVQNA